MSSDESLTRIILRLFMASVTLPALLVTACAFDDDCSLLILGNESCAGAGVVVDGTVRGTMKDRGGAGAQLSIALSPGKTYTIEFRREGFRPGAQQVKIPKGASEYYLACAMTALP